VKGDANGRKPIPALSKGGEIKPDIKFSLVD
jgi:hypothetical protein